jgi:hypothetical protein
MALCFHVYAQAYILFCRAQVVVTLPLSLVLSLVMDDPARKMNRFCNVCVQMAPEAMPIEANYCCWCGGKTFVVAVLDYSGGNGGGGNGGGGNGGNGGHGGGGDCGKKRKDDARCGGGNGGGGNGGNGGGGDCGKKKKFGKC